MKSVVKYELLSYFTNIPGYVFGAFILLFAGIYTTVNNLKAGSMNFEYVLQGMSFIFLIAVPVLTMRVLAEERSQRTDTLLYSLPASCHTLSVWFRESTFRSSLRNPRKNHCLFSGFMAGFTLSCCKGDFSSVLVSFS